MRLLVSRAGEAFSYLTEKNGTPKRRSDRWSSSFPISLIKNYISSLLSSKRKGRLPRTFEQDRKMDFPKSEIGRSGHGEGPKCKWIDYKIRWWWDCIDRNYPQRNRIDFRNYSSLKSALQHGKEGNDCFVMREGEIHHFLNIYGFWETDFPMRSQPPNTFLSIVPMCLSVCKWPGITWRDYTRSIIPNPEKYYRGGNSSAGWICRDIWIFKKLKLF